MRKVELLELCSHPAWGALVEWLLELEEQDRVDLESLAGQPLALEARGHLRRAQEVRALPALLALVDKKEEDNPKILDDGF